MADAPVLIIHLDANGEIIRVIEPGPREDYVGPDDREIERRRLKEHPMSGVDEIQGVFLVRSQIGNPTARRCVVDSLGNVWCP